MDLLDSINEYLVANALTMCRFSFDIETVLKNQTDYYLTSYDEIKMGLEPPATELVNAITLQANTTLVAPLKA